MSLRVVSLEYLGVVAARLRRDAVTSQLRTDTIDQLLKQVREDTNNDSAEETKPKKHKKKKKGGDKENEKENNPEDRIQVCFFYRSSYEQTNVSRYLRCLCFFSCYSSCSHYCWIIWPSVLQVIRHFSTPDIFTWLSGTWRPLQILRVKHRIILEETLLSRMSPKRRKVPKTNENGDTPQVKTRRLLHPRHLLTKTMKRTNKNTITAVPRITLITNRHY
jgi:hypothetical protein